MTFKELLNKKIKTFETHLDAYWEKCGTEPDQVFFNDVLKYNMLAGGKRLRPILTLEFCQLFQGNYEDALPFAIAMEMIHTYSLIHDDLPCMDDDDLRRGQATTHVKFSEDVAVLAGDALLNGAHELMIDATLSSDNPLLSLKAMEIVSKAAGKEGMIRGQLLDIQNENTSLSIESLNKINDLKTGALLKASMLSGAILGGADEQSLESIGLLARNIGLMFQIKDDLLDIYGDQDLLGKPVGSDERNFKSTYPEILGLEETEKVLLDMEREAKDILNVLPGDLTFVNGLIHFIVDRKN